MIQILISLLFQVSPAQADLAATTPLAECNTRRQVYNKACDKPESKPAIITSGHLFSYENCPGEKIKKYIPKGIHVSHGESVPTVGVPIGSPRFEPWTADNATIIYDNVPAGPNLAPHDLCIATEISGNKKDVMGYRLFNKNSDGPKLIYWATYSQPEQIALVIGTKDGYAVRCLERPLGSERGCKVYDGAKSKLELGALSTTDLERLRMGTPLKEIAGDKLKPLNDTTTEVEATQ